MRYCGGGGGGGGGCATLPQYLMWVSKALVSERLMLIKPKFCFIGLHAGLSFDFK